MQECKFNPPTCGSKGFHFIIKDGKVKLVTRRELNEIPIGTKMYKVKSEDGSRAARRKAQQEFEENRTRWLAGEPTQGDFIRSPFDRLKGYELDQAISDSDVATQWTYRKQLELPRDWFFDTDGYCRVSTLPSGRPWSSSHLPGTSRHTEADLKFDPEGYDVEGFDRGGFNRRGFNADGVSRGGVFSSTGTRFDTDGFDVNGFDADGCHRDGFNSRLEGDKLLDEIMRDPSKAWKHRRLLPPEARSAFFYPNGVCRLTPSAYAPDGYDKDGFNEAGFNEEGVHCVTGTTQDLFTGCKGPGRGRGGFELDGTFTENGTPYDRAGRDCDGFDRGGFNANGVNRQGFYREGHHWRTGTTLDVSGFAADGYNVNGYDRDGRDREGFDTKGLLSGGVDRYGIDEHGFSDDGVHIGTGLYQDNDGFDRSGKNEDGYSRSDFRWVGPDRQMVFVKREVVAWEIDSYGTRDEEVVTPDTAVVNGFRVTPTYTTEPSLVGENVFVGFDISHLETGGEYDPEGYDINGYNAYGIDRAGFRKNGSHLLETHTPRLEAVEEAVEEDSSSLDPYGRDENGLFPGRPDAAMIEDLNTGYGADGFNQSGYNRAGVDLRGFTANGTFVNTNGSISRWDESGFDVDGFHKTTGRDRDGFDRFGYDVDGYSRRGYNRQGVSRDGLFGWTGTRFDADGFDINGFDADGFDRSGFNAVGVDRNGYTRDGVPGG